MKQKLFNPFIQTAGLKALLIGLLFLILTSALAGVFYTRFDGVLDIHFGDNHHFITPFFDNLINVCSLTIFFYLGGVILTKGRTRLVDILGTMTLARFPLFLAPLLNINNFVGEIGEKIVSSLIRKVDSFSITSTEITVLTISSILLLLIVIWYVSLLYRAYTTSTNLKGVNAVVSFIIALILAEICSSILIHSFL